MIGLKTVTTRIPEEDEKHLKEIEKERRAKRSVVLRKIIEDGIQQWRRERALKLLDEHKVTLRKAAKIAGVTYIEILDLAGKKGIETGYDLKELERDMERV